MTDPNPALAPVAPSPFSFELAETLPLTAEQRTVTLDRSLIPPEARSELLNEAIRTRIVNRVNVANVRFNKANEPFAAYAKYQAALAAHTADPITVPHPGPPVPAPTGTAPTPVDFVAKVNEAIADLYKGDLGRRTGEPGKSRTPKDPVDKAVTSIVVKEVFDNNKASNAKYTYPDAVKTVGSSGVTYLLAKIDELVAAGQDRAKLVEFMERRYLAPARILAGVDTLKGKAGELPNIL